MVEMLPDLLAPEIKSKAEADLFHEFKNHETSERYIILHSLGLSEHVNNIFGEIDFVVICSMGVLCIEVKGGEVRRGIPAKRTVIRPSFTNAVPRTCENAPAKEIVSVRFHCNSP